MSSFDFILLRGMADNTGISTLFVRLFAEVVRSDIKNWIAISINEFQQLSRIFQSFQFLSIGNSTCNNHDNLIPIPQIFILNFVEYYIQDYCLKNVKSSSFVKITANSE